MKNKKPKNKKMYEILRESTAVQVPYYAWTKMGGSKQLEVFGNQTALSPEADYATVEEVRKALEWYIDQFGGTVTWRK
ncbi:MAG: hypothetical protein FMNOHCHN_03789 [Ignavibacteriaceae bacterium]|nr:hypothetical protein [Ignavibacteriaceae bacterium]